MARIGGVNAGPGGRASAVIRTVLFLTAVVQTSPSESCVRAPDLPTVDDARRDLPRVPLIIDGVVIDPMRRHRSGLITPATVRVTKVWKGPQLRTVQVHYLSNCDEMLTKTGSKLYFAMLAQREEVPPSLTWWERLMLTFDPALGGLSDRFDRLYGSRVVYHLTGYAIFDQPYENEIRRLLGQPGPFRWPGWPAMP